MSAGGGSSRSPPVCSWGTQTEFSKGRTYNRSGDKLMVRRDSAGVRLQSLSASISFKTRIALDAVDFPLVRWSGRPNPLGVGREKMGSHIGVSGRGSPSHTIGGFTSLGPL